MSKIGNKPILIPKDIEITINNHEITCKGVKGELKLKVRPEINIEKKDSQILVKTNESDKASRSYHGLFHKLIDNMIVGVAKGFEKKLEVVGVGYRIIPKGKDLELYIGFSHPVIIKAPLGINLVVKKNTITIIGNDKQLVGQVAAKIRSIRKPEPYKGKGIKYIDEIIKRKAGKTAKTVGEGVESKK